MAARAFITGLSGLNVSANERAFLREAQPWGLIIFKRNVNTPQQVAELTKSFRDAVGWAAPVLVDQEGGRVQRLGPPHWPIFPPGARYGAIYDRDVAFGLAAARLGGHLIAAELSVLGIDVDCLPLADVLVPGSEMCIRDSAYGTEPGKVAAIAGAIAQGLLAGGVLPVLKHLPGHGRASVDSHAKLPVVDTDRATLESTDFAAFRPLASLPLGMTAHVVFSAIDPDAPATTSVTMVREVIRGFIGFRGLLMSDDVSMKALSGTIAERSRAAFAAGCDVVLHCNGDLNEMSAVASQAPELKGAAAKRAEAALGRCAFELRRLGGYRAHLVEVAVAVEHDVASGGKRGAAALRDRAGQRLHRDVVAHQQAPESNKPANHFAHHCDRSCGRCIRVDGGKHNMGGHAERQGGQGPEGGKIGRFQGGPVGTDHWQFGVAVHAGAAMPGPVLKHL